MSSVIIATKENFEEIVIKEEGKTVLVDFWAEWCGPCRTLAPILDELAEEESLKENTKIVKVNVDDHSDLAQKYGVRGIPTMIFFKNGEATKTLVGIQNKDELKKTLEELT